jgi:hypothetical protein
LPFGENRGQPGTPPSSYNGRQFMVAVSQIMIALRE